MLRNIICILLLLSSSDLLSQSISYSFGYGLPRATDADQQSFSLTENYKKSQEFSLSLGLNGTGTLADEMEIRLTTYNSTLINSLETFGGTRGVNISIRKYIMELQSYYYRFDLKKIGSIDLGSKASYILRSDISGFNFNNPGIETEISSVDYIREGKFYVSLLAKYSLLSIKLTDNYSIRPSYTFSYSINRDIRSLSTNTRLINHIFELAFLTNLNPKH